MKCLNNPTSAFYPWACEGAFEKTQGDECASSASPYEYKSGYIEVTPYIESLANSIEIADDDTPYQLFSSILNLIFNEHKTFINSSNLVSLFQSSIVPQPPMSQEESDEFLIRAIDGALTDEDKFLIGETLVWVRPIYEKAQKKYYDNPEAYRDLINRLDRIEGYHPLAHEYPMAFTELANSIKEGPTLYEVDNYLRYQTRVEVLSAMLSDDISAERNQLLKQTVGYPLNPNAYSMFPGNNLSPEARADDAYMQYVGNWDYPHSITAHDVLKYNIASGCTHAAIAFMSLARAMGYNDVRFVTAIFNSSYNRKYCVKGSKSKPVIDRYVDSHKLVLVCINGSYHLINTTQYPLEVISTTYDGEPIDPETLVGKDILIQSLVDSGDEAGPLLRVRAIGESSDDYMFNDSAEHDANILMSGRFDIEKHDCHEYPLPEFGRDS